MAILLTMIPVTDIRTHTKNNAVGKKGNVQQLRQESEELDANLVHQPSFVKWNKGNHMIPIYHYPFTDWSMVCGHHSAGPENIIQLAIYNAWFAIGCPFGTKLFLRIQSGKTPLSVFHILHFLPILLRDARQHSSELWNRFLLNWFDWTASFPTSSNWSEAAGMARHSKARVPRA